MISHRVTVSCSPVRAFRLLTERMDLWWPTVAERGGRIEFRAEPGAGIDHVGPWGIVRLADVEKVDAPHHILLAWTGGRPDVEPLVVEISLTASDGGTTVELSIGETVAWPASSAGATHVRLPEPSPTRVVL